MTTGAELNRYRLAEKIELFTDGLLCVTYEPRTFRNQDPDSAGHLFFATLSDRGDELELDDRAGPLPQQLVAECRRVAALYRDLADTIERRLPSRNTADTHGT